MKMEKKFFFSCNLPLPSFSSPDPFFFFFLSFLRAIAECFARLSHGLGVRPCVTLVICIKTVQARITKSSPCLLYTSDAADE